LSFKYVNKTNAKNNLPRFEHVLISEQISINRFAIEINEHKTALVTVSRQ
jgi:hypothetical protein